MIRARGKLLPVLLLCGTLLFGAACADAAAERGAAVADPTTAPGAVSAGNDAATTAAPPTSGSVAATTPTTAGAATLSADERDPNPNTAAAMAHVRKLAEEIGVRSSGSAEEQAAAAYIAERLRAYGYEVELQRFPVTEFISRRVSLSVDGGRALNVQPITNSSPGAVRGELVFAGLGKPGEFPATTRGRVALVQRGEITFRDKAVNAQAAGATALVVFNNQDDLFLGSLRENPPAIPVFAISGTDGRALRERLTREAVPVAAEFDGGLEQADSINVIGRPPGGRCEVVLGGHYDSVPGAPGASDNASGTAAVLEMARLTALRGGNDRACFVAFASEETGLNGSKQFVGRLSAEERSALRFMLNFDMVAFGTEWLLIGSPALQEQGKAIASRQGVVTRATMLVGASSDHASFIEAGIPALFLHRSDDPLLHTPEDVIGRLSPEQLVESVRLGLAFLAEVRP